MAYVSFLRAACTDPGRIPEGFQAPFKSDLSTIKTCEKCTGKETWKPERAHHCRECGFCVFKMDHHCPWINNCIGFWNRKFFILLLIYVLVVTYWVVLTMSFAWLESIQWSLDAYYYSTKERNQ